MLKWLFINMHIHLHCQYVQTSFSIAPCSVVLGPATFYVVLRLAPRLHVLWTKWVILWAASKCCAILSIMRYINRNSRAVIGDKCTSSINRWTPPPAPPHQGNAHVMCTSTKQLASWDNVVKESLRQSLLAVINMKQVVCRNCDRSLPCWGSTTNLLGWKREVWVS